MERKIFNDQFIIFAALDDAKVENIIVLYARENKFFKYKADWLKEVWTCFDRKFIEPRIVNVDTNAAYSYFDGKRHNDIAIKFVEDENHKKMEAVILQRNQEQYPQTKSERG